MRRQKKQTRTGSASQPPQLHPPDDHRLSAARGVFLAVVIGACFWLLVGLALLLL